MTTRTRGRRPATADAPAAEATPSRSQAPSLIRRGNAGRVQAQAEAEESRKRREGGRVSRFWMEKGEAREIIILDAKDSDIVFFYEHHIPGPGGNWAASEYVPCIREFTNCPICDGSGQKGGEAKNPYYAMFLTILDLTPYTDKKGVERPYSRRLLCVKNPQQPDFFRLFDHAMKDHGKIRGMNLYMERGNGSNSPRTGEPVMLPGTAVMYEMLSEKDLVDEFGHEAVTSEGKEIYPANGLLQPFDYDKLFPDPDVDAIKRRFSGADEHGDGFSEPRATAHRRARGGQPEASARGRAAPDAASPASYDAGFDDDIPF